MYMDRRSVARAAKVQCWITSCSVQPTLHTSLLETQLTYLYQSTQFLPLHTTSEPVPSMGPKLTSPCHVYQLHHLHLYHPQEQQDQPWNAPPIYHRLSPDKHTARQVIARNIFATCTTLYSVHCTLYKLLNLTPSIKFFKSVILLISSSRPNICWSSWYSSLVKAPG